MADFNSILQEDTTNVNMSGSNVEPYALSNSDIAKTTPAQLNNPQPEEVVPINQELPLDNIKVTPSKEEQQMQQQEQQLQQEQNKANLEVSQQIRENQPPLTWDTAREDQRLYINSEKGGSTFYEFYVPELDKVINTNTTDPKEINRQIALSNAKTQEERNFIFNSSYFDDKLVVYTGPKNNLLTTVLKGIGSTTVDAVKGAVQFVVANRANNKIKNLERLMDQLSSLTLTPQMKEMYMTASDITAAGAGFYSLSKDEQQEFLKEAYKKYKDNVAKQIEKEVDTMPTNEMLAQEAMFKKLIKDPIETLQNKDNDKEALNKYKEWIDKNKEYISPSLLKSQEKLEQEFKNDTLFAQMRNDAKVRLTKIADISNKFKEAVHISYVPEVDSPYAYQAGQMGFSYAGQLVALATGHLELAGVFAASQFGDTIDKAIENGLPLEISTDAANKTALFQYVTEKIQLSLFRANFASLSKYISIGMLNTVAENALQEGVQDFGTKAIEQFYGVDSFTVEDYILDFCINAGIGAVMSVPMGAIVAHSKAKYVNAFTQKFPSMKKADAIALADKVISYGTQALSTTEGKNALYQGIMDMTRNIADTGVQAKASENANQQDLKTVQDAAYEYLIQSVSPEQKMKYMQDSKSAENFTKKYLTEQVGMFEAEAAELSKGLKNLYSSLQMTMGMSQRQIAERMLPNTVNMMALSALSNYKYVDNKNDFIKFESSVLKTIFKNLGPIDHLTDADFLSMAKDVINGIPLTEVADKYKVLYQPEKYDLIRNQVLLDKMDKTSFAVMLASSNIKDKGLTNTLEQLISTNPNSEQYVRLLNDFNIKLNEALNNKSIAGALFANNKEISNPVEAFNTLFLNKPIAGVDIHEVGHFFDIVFYANQMCAKLGLPTTTFNIKIMNLYNALGRKITGNSNFIYNPYNYTDPDQIKVAEALPNIMADYFKNGTEYSKESAELIKYISSLYKYINSNTSVTSEYADTKEAKELVQEIQKQEKEDELSIAIDKLLKLADTGDFNNQDIYNIVKDLKLNEALKLALYIEKGQHPVVTLIQAINDINNTRVDSMYRKSIDFNEDIIPSKYMTIPEGSLFEEQDEYKMIQQAKQEWEASDKSLQAARDIFKKYGIYQDEQGSWGYIISDKDMSINKETFQYIKDNLGKLNEFDSKLKLGELIDHKQLFNIDPTLKSIRLNISDKMGKNNPAALDISGVRPTLMINSNLFKNNDYQELRSSLAHEIQHALDKSAKLKLGGDMFGAINNFIKGDSRFKDVLDFINKGTELKKKNKSGNINEQEKSMFQQMLYIAEKAFDIYRSDIGETRARTTQDDIDKSIEELFNEPLPTERRDIKPTVSNTDVTVANFNKQESFDKIMKDYNVTEEEQELNFTVSDIMSDGFSKTFAVVSESIKKDSPKMFAHSRQAMFRAMQDVKRYKEQAKALVKEINKMSDEDKYSWEKAWNNRDFTALVKLADKYDFRDEIVAIRTTLNELHQVVCSAFEGESYNQLLGYLTDYFPRLVIDHDGLASYLVARDSDKGTVSTDTPETTNNKYGKWMDKVKQWLEDDINYSKKKVGSPYFYKGRQIEFVDDGMLKFYAKSTDAFDNYINKVQDILFRKYFFGEGYVKEFMNSADNGKNININGIDYVIPNWKERVKKMGFLTGDKKTDARILSAIESVFFRGDTGSFGAIYRTATNILTINSFFSALSNLGDLALTLYNYGFKNTIQAVKDVAVKDAPLTSEDLGIVDLYEEFKADGTKLKKVFNAVMKWSGFNYLDRFTKEVNVQAALLDAKRALETSGEKTEQVIDRIYMYMGGDEEAANALIANIINGNWKDQDVKLFAFNELSNQQPITKLEVPEFYNKYPQFRVLYLYKTFAVKQLNFAYANILSDIKNNPKEGIKKLVRFMAWLMAVGVTKDIIADMLKGKEIHLTDSAMFSISSFFFLNEYNYYTFKNKGAIMGMFHMVMPPVPLMTEISSDIKRASKGKIDNPFQLKIMRGVPVVGKPFQYWFGN